MAKLRLDVEGIHRHAAANQMLKSGNTIFEVKNECVSTIKSLGDVASQELLWVLSQSFFANPKAIDACNALARRSLGTARDDCSTILKKTVGICGDDRHFVLTEPELRGQEQHSLMAISLALDTKYSELQLQRKRSLLGFFQRILSFLLGRG